MAEISKKFNTAYNGTVPYSLGDRYYSQDLLRDQLWSMHSANSIARDLVQDFPFLLSGGTVSQGAGTTINITQAVGYVYKSFTIPDTFAALPPSSTPADVICRVATTQQTNLAVAGATADGSTVNYVKVQYAETTLNSRSYAKASGSYGYEVTPSFTITVNATAPTNYDMVVASFTLTGGGTFTFTQYPTRNLKSQIPVGTIIDYAGLIIPDGWINCAGVALSKTGYSQLYNAICPAQSCTVSVATVCIITASGHGLISGMNVSFETTGSLPTPVAINTNFWVTVVDVNTFKLSSSVANYIAGSFVNTLGQSQSGSHTLRKSSFGISGTSFLTPDLRGIRSVGHGIQSTATNWVGSVSNHSGVIGYYDEDGGQAHYHYINIFGGGGGSVAYVQTTSVNLGSVLNTLSGYVAAPITDGTHGTPRTGYITKPSQLGVYKLIKYI